LDLSPEDYCRHLESYLCRRNEGHLIRIVGPAFEQVCGWALRGVPLKVAQRGIDRYCERYYAKGPRRRPVRIEFCEADVLDVFDEWRRAVGVPVPADAGATSGDGEDAVDSSRRHGSLPAHLDRVIARLTALRAGEDRTLDGVLDAIARELDAVRSTAKGIRGEARVALLARLAALDRELLDAARGRCGEGLLRQLGDEADAELAPFRVRLAPEQYARSRDACIDRLVRERQRLPVVAYDA
jgi:hypothetical protein